MGMLLSILFSYVGAVELAFIVRDIVHQISLHHQQIESNRSLSNGLEQIQEHLRASIEIARLSNESDNIQCMADGVRYENGYRIDDIKSNDNDLRLTKANAEFKRCTNDEITCNYNDHSIKLNGVENKLEHNETIKSHTKRLNENDSDRISSQIPIDNDALNQSTDENRSRKIPSNGSTQNDQQINQSNRDISITNRNENEKIKLNHENSESNHLTKKHSRHSTRSPPLRQCSDDEVNDPWGDMKPEHYHDTELWKRERRLTIPELDVEDELLTSNADVKSSIKAQINKLDVIESEESSEIKSVCSQEKVISVFMFF